MLLCTKCFFLTVKNAIIIFKRHAYVFYLTHTHCTAQMTGFIKYKPANKCQKNKKKAFLKIWKTKLCTSHPSPYRKMKDLGSSTPSPSSMLQATEIPASSFTNNQTNKTKKLPTVTSSDSVQTSRPNNQNENLIIQSTSPLLFHIILIVQ